MEQQETAPESHDEAGMASQQQFPKSAGGATLQQSMPQNGLHGGVNVPQHQSHLSVFQQPQQIQQAHQQAQPQQQQQQQQQHVSGAHAPPLTAGEQAAAAASNALHQQPPQHIQPQPPMVAPPAPMQQQTAGMPSVPAGWPPFPMPTAQHGGGANATQPQQQPSTSKPTAAFMIPSTAPMMNPMPLLAAGGMPGGAVGAPGASAATAAPLVFPPGLASPVLPTQPANGPTPPQPHMMMAAAAAAADGSNGGKRKAEALNVTAPEPSAPKQAKLSFVNTNSVQEQPSVVSSYSENKSAAASAALSASAGAATEQNSLDAAAASLDLMDAEAANIGALEEKLSAAATPAERRRFERNLREQQRSYRISQQIKLLRDVLEENKIPFKPNKFSILVSVVEYIKQLQTRAIMLDSEHERLVETMRQTNDLVVNGGPAQTSSSEDDSQGDPGGGGVAGAALPDAFQSTEMLVKGLVDYERVFTKCPSALGIASLDGRVLACNNSFEDLLAVQQQSILQQSMFMYIRNHQDVFEAMADLLKRSSTVAAAAASGTTTSGEQQPQQQAVAKPQESQQTTLLFWCGYVISLQANKKLAFSITLTNTANGDPKYFSLSAAETTLSL